MNNFHPLDPALIVGVARLADVVGQNRRQGLAVRGSMGLDGTVVGEMDPHLKGFAGMDERGDGGHRQDIGGQQIVAEQSIEQTALAPLELTENRQVKPSFGETLLHGFKFVAAGDIVGTKPGKTRRSPGQQTGQVSGFGGLGNNCPVHVVLFAHPEIPCWRGLACSPARFTEYEYMGSATIA